MHSFGAENGRYQIGALGAHFPLRGHLSWERNVRLFFAMDHVPYGRRCDRRASPFQNSDVCHTIGQVGVGLSPQFSALSPQQHSVGGSMTIEPEASRRRGGLSVSDAYRARLAELNGISSVDLG